MKSFQFTATNLREDLPYFGVLLLGGIAGGMMLVIAGLVLA